MVNEDKLTITALFGFQNDMNAVVRGHKSVKDQVLEILGVASWYTRQVHCTTTERVKITKFAHKLVDEVLFGLCNKNQLAYVIEASF